jgi:hypothetical protein
MSKIIYLNQKLLSDTRLSNFLGSYNYNWTHFNNITKLNPGHDGGYIRTGKNVYPLKNDLISELNFQVPDYDSNFSMSFSDVTDLRLQQLIKSHSNKRWLVLWSGGIDSMVIIVSILKNLSPAERANIDVACNRISIYEHPKFFYEYIQPNFNIIDSNFLKLNEPIFEKYYVIDGEPADQLYGGIASRSMIDGKTILKDWRRDPDELIDFLTDSVDRPFAEWYYDTAKQNIDSMDVPIENYYDFCWWLFFNASWSAIMLRPLQFQTTNSVNGVKLYFDNFIHWFNTVEYQKWSMVSRFGIKYEANINNRKLASKKYIYDFDRDEYYFHFKTKIESTSRFVSNANSYFCMLDDYTRLTLDNNPDQILELLPAHINADVVTGRY